MWQWIGLFLAFVPLVLIGGLAGLWIHRRVQRRRRPWLWREHQSWRPTNDTCRVTPRWPSADDLRDEDGVPY